ncbi:MAG TPA: nucleotidyl transferase AbiEii/AbiGii toxin family protein [Candidatus Baltobacteraceae bacterium]
MNVNSDFTDLLSELNAASARYLIVGGVALAFHDQPRFTKDIDILIARSPENAKRVHHALARFGAPLDQISVEDLTSPELIVQIGVDPARVDVLTDIDGISFEEAWLHRIDAIYGDVPVSVISREDLIKNKLASGRTQDLADVERLRQPP